MDLPSVEYLEAMEAGNYQRALQDKATREAWNESEDALAHALLLVAQVHRDAVTGDVPGALECIEKARNVLEQVSKDWTARALGQHVDQCEEYLSMGKPLPDLPSGL